YRLGPDKWFLVSTAAAPKPGEGAVKVDEVEVKVDPRAEWAQIYRETWRIERDFLYDPNAHGLDLAAAQKKYEPYLAGLGSRHDLGLVMEGVLGGLWPSPPARAWGRAPGSGRGPHRRGRAGPNRSGRRSGPFPCPATTRPALPPRHGER